MKKININPIINILLFLYILSAYIFSFRTETTSISNFIALLLIGLIWLNFLLTKRRLIFNKFLLTYLIFIFISLISSLYAINQYAAFDLVKTLILLFILMLSLINYLDSFEKIRKLLIYFIFSGFFASIYILLNSDFSQVTRFGSELGNVNAVGMILGISTVFSFYFILVEKKYLFIPILLTNFVTILLTGSRKSLLFILLTFIIIMLTQERLGLKSKLKAFFGSIIIIFICLYIIYNIPFFYEIIGGRMENLLSFIFGEGTNEGSINTRQSMIEVGFSLFKERPLTGFGIDNYRFLYGGVTGEIGTYSHNNFIELLVGTGIFGFFFFYLTHFLVLKDLIKAAKINDKKTLCYCFIAIICAYILLSVGLVYYFSKHISIVLVVGSVIYKLTKLEKKEEKGK